MSEFLKLILSLSLSGTVLILLLFLFRPLYEKRLSKRWQYYIWIVVIARLLLPIAPETSLMGTLFHQAGQTEPPGIYTGSIKEQTPEPTEYSSGINSDATSKQESGSNYMLTGPQADNAENIYRTIVTVWIVAALLLFMRKITVYQSFAKYVNAGSNPVDDITLLERFGEIMAQNHIKKTIDLSANSLLSSPLLIGFIRPRIVLPNTDLSESDFYYTILHELTHYKRHDMLYKWLVQFTVCLHWFNPLVYLMGREINRLCELSCDERVIMPLSEDARRSYGDTLVNAAGTGGSYKNTLASVTLNESKELLKGRLDAIMKYRKIPKAAKSAAIFITGILIGSAAVLGAYAAQDSDTASGIRTSSKPVTTPTPVPSTAGGTLTDERKNAVQDLDDIGILYENGIYYIFADGTTKADKPVSAVTGGYKKLVLVHKDGYITFGAFTDYDMLSLVKYITEQCRTMLANGRITQENMDIVISAAAEIQEIYRSENDVSPIRRDYTYKQAAYCQLPYIIEIGYNLPASSQDYYDSSPITLSDGSTMPVYFSEESGKYMSDEEAMSAVTALIKRMVPWNAGTSHPVETPFILSMDYVGGADLNSLAEKYYTEEPLLPYFGAVFLELDSSMQQEYLDLMFEEENISFFACCISMLADAGIQEDTVDHYTLKAYQEDRINFFAVLSGMLDDNARKQWLEKCKRDGKTHYWYILSEDYDSLYDPDGYPDGYDESSVPTILDLNRTTKQELPENLQDILDSCDSGKWYVIGAGNRRYIYYNGLPHTYAYSYEPQVAGGEDSGPITVEITDIEVSSPLLRNKEAVGDYVLLVFSCSPDIPDTDYGLAITYNKMPVSYEFIRIDS